MKTRFLTIFAAVLFAACASLTITGCASTKNEGGVTIEKQRSYNPLSWF